MTVKIPETHTDLLVDPVFVTLVTVMPDGHPQSTPVWCNYDGERIWVNSAKGRQKDQNMRRDKRVTVSAIDPNNPYRWIEVRGEVTEITEDGAVDHINSLSKLYTGNGDYFSHNPSAKNDTRVIYKIAPQRVNYSG